MVFRTVEEVVHVSVCKALPVFKFIGNSILMPICESRVNHNVAWLIGSRSEHDIELNTPQLEWERELPVSRIEEVVEIVSAFEGQVWNEANKVASVEAGHGIWIETESSEFGPEAPFIAFLALTKGADPSFISPRQSVSSNSLAMIWEYDCILKAMLIYYTC